MLWSQRRNRAALGAEISIQISALAGEPRTLASSSRKRYRDVLHWLPVPLRVEFKICLLVYKSLHGAAPGYLRDYCKETHSSASGLRLRSTDKCDLLVRRMKTR